MKRFILLLTLSLILPRTNHAQVENLWTRLDMDRSGFTVKIGGSGTGFGLNWEHSLLLWHGPNNAEFDIGPAFSLADGKLVVSPELGLEVNMNTGLTNFIMPILFVFFDSEKSHVQLWNFYYHGVHKTTQDGNIYYGRYFYKYDLTGGFAAGLQAELSYDLSDVQAGVLSMPVGLKADWGYGENNTLGCFIGRDTQAEEPTMVIRVSFIRSF